MKKVILFVLAVYVIYYAYHILRDMFSSKSTDIGDQIDTKIAFEDLEHQPEKVDAFSLNTNEVSSNEVSDFFEEEEIQEEIDYEMQLEEEEDLSEVEVLSKEIEREDKEIKEKLASIEKGNEELEKTITQQKSKLSFFSKHQETEVSFSNSFSKSKNNLIQELLANPDSIDISQELALLAS